MDLKDVLVPKEEIACRNCGRDFMPKTIVTYYCPECEPKVYAQEEAREKAEQRRKRLSTLRIGKRFEGASFENFDPGRANRHALEVCEEWTESAGQQDGEGLYIHGGVGTGKTHLAVAIILAAPVTGRFVNTLDLLDEIKASYNGQHSTLEFECESSSLLVLDDLGAERQTEWVLERFYLLINQRYWEQRPTVYTSNLSIEELRERMSGTNPELGRRICSRIAGVSQIVEVKGNDRRKNR